MLLILQGLIDELLETVLITQLLVEGVFCYDLPVVKSFKLVNKFACFKEDIPPGFNMVDVIEV